MLSKIIDWTDRSTCVLFGDGAGAVVLEPVDDGGFLGFELGADGAGGPSSTCPAAARGCRRPEIVASDHHFVQMNGREVFKFATRVLVSVGGGGARRSADMTIDDVDVYVPHQANVRIIDHAREEARHPGGEGRRQRRPYGNTSSGSIPLALADAAADGRLRRASSC